MGRLGKLGVLGRPNQALSDVEHGARNDVGVTWSSPGWSGGAEGGDVALTADRLHVALIFISSPITFDRVGLFVLTADGGSSIRLGLYTAECRNAGDGLLPKSLLTDYGTVSSASTGQKEITISTTLQRGYYFTAFISDGTPAIRGLSHDFGVRTPMEGFQTGIGALTAVLLGKSGQTGVVSGGMSATFPLPMTNFHSSTRLAVFFRSVAL